jgi:hypothetical protein
MSFYRPSEFSTFSEGKLFLQKPWKNHLIQVGFLWPKTQANIFLNILIWPQKSKSCCNKNKSKKQKQKQKTKTKEKFSRSMSEVGARVIHE